MTPARPGPSPEGSPPVTTHWTMRMVLKVCGHRRAGAGIPWIGGEWGERLDLLVGHVFALRIAARHD